MSSYLGLIKAGIGALGSTLADQWKELFYCDAMEMDVLVKKGSKRIGKRSSNTKELMSKCPAPGDPKALEERCISVNIPENE